LPLYTGEGGQEIASKGERAARREIRATREKVRKGGKGRRERGEEGSEEANRAKRARNRRGERTKVEKGENTQILKPANRTFSNLTVVALKSGVFDPTKAIPFATIVRNKANVWPVSSPF
jgi:hypothetical protein